MNPPCYLQNYRSAGLRYHILTWHKARWAHLLFAENLYLWILTTLQDIQSQMEPNKLQRIRTWSAIAPHDATPKMASHLSWYHSMIFASENRRKNSFTSCFNFMKLNCISYWYEKLLLCTCLMHCVQKSYICWSHHCSWQQTTGNNKVPYVSKVIYIVLWPSWKATKRDKP